jgi:hypothetical protein
MARSSIRSDGAQRVPQASVAALDAMALLARQSGLTIHVVLPRAPGVVEHARQVALAAGVGVTADLAPFSVRVRFAPAAVAARS